MQNIQNVLVVIPHYCFVIVIVLNVGKERIADVLLCQSNEMNPIINCNKDKISHKLFLNLWYVFLAITFQVSTFFYFMSVLIKRNLLCFTETYVCWRKAFYAIAHDNILYYTIIKYFTLYI